MDFVNSLHKIFSYKFIAWDIAITDFGPCFIEGNPPGDWCVPQLLGDIALFETEPFQAFILGNHKKYLEKYER